VFGAIPIYETRHHHHHGAVFANLSKEIPTMGPRYAPFYGLPFAGAISLANDLDKIIRHHSIDTIVAIDGGVDCLMHGDEEDAGTILQDFITLAALNNLKSLDQSHITVACIGLGCEAEENMNFGAVIENISTLIVNGGFYGSCSLVHDAPEFQLYKEALTVWSGPRKSHIQTRIIAAAEGVYGQASLGEDANLSPVTSLFASETLEAACIINPFMSMYWFFDFRVIAAQNKLLSVLAQSESTGDALRRFRMAVKRTRPHARIVI
jgi:hypothetical protein